MHRITGYDKDGIPRVFAEDNYRQTAVGFCKEEAAAYVRRRPDTGPLNKWRFGDAVEVGDVVLWRDHSNPHALGIANCEVVELGQDKDGNPVAMILALGEKVGALVADLHHA